MTETRQNQKMSDRPEGGFESGVPQYVSSERMRMGRALNSVLKQIVARVEIFEQLPNLPAPLGAILRASP